MSSLLHEEVPRMPPMSTAQLERIAELVLEELCPAALQRPTRLDLAHLVDYELPRLGIYVSPATPAELQDREAATDPSGNGPIEILLGEDHWENLPRNDRRANRARSTVGHELGHAIIHVPVIRRYRNHVHAELLLARHRRKDIVTYEDPEWQAWTLGTSILAPRRTLEMLPGRTLSELSETYGVSDVLLAAHLRRLKMPIPK